MCSVLKSLCDSEVARFGTIFTFMFMYRFNKQNTLNKTASEVLVARLAVKLAKHQVRTFSTTPQLRTYDSVC